MNENNDYNRGNVRPYKATANLNTAIANPSINVNDTMDVNIQNYKENNPNINNVQSYNNSEINNSHLYESNVKINETANNIPTNQLNTNTVFNTNNVNTIQNSNARNEAVTNTSNDFVKKTYVTKDNKPKKKKTVSLNMGPEFKIGLLIIVILLAFVFVLPILNDLIMGY